MSQQQIQAAPPRNNVEVMAQYVMPAPAFNILRNLETIIRIVMSWSTITLEVFIRREFGERYLSFGRMILGWLTIRFFLSIANLRNTFSWVPGVSSLASEVTINRGFVTCYMLLCLVHLFRVWQRNRAGIPWHSHSFGVSWLEFLTTLPPLRIGGINLTITDFILYRFIEPGLCFLVAWFLVPGPSFTRNWLIWSSLAMLVHNNMAYAMRRARFLDMLDSQIESGYYNSVREEALDHSSKYQTAGHAVMPMPSQPLLEKMDQADLAATVLEIMGRGKEPDRQVMPDEA